MEPMSARLAPVCRALSLAAPLLSLSLTAGLSVAAGLSMAAEKGRAVGTLEAVQGGEPRTWHVYAGGDVPGATWMKRGPGRYTATITGFEAAGGRMEGSQLTISFEFAEGEGRADHRIPHGPRGSADVRLMPDVDDLTVIHTLKKGRVTAERIDLSGRDTYRFAGTFSGTLANSDGQVVGALTGGRFRVERAKQAAPE